MPTGSVGDYLPTDAWYDPRGNVAKTETGEGPFQKSSYDSAGRLVASYTSFDATEYAMSEDEGGQVRY
jgi:YD repeat-containing protein